MVGLIGIAALLLIAVVTVVVMRSARDRSLVTVNEPSAGPAFALTSTAVGLVPPTAPPETPGAAADSTLTTSSQPTVVAAQGAVAGVSTSISPVKLTVSSSEGAEAATPGLSPAPPATPSPAMAIDFGASPPPSPQMAGDSGASAALVGHTTYLPLTFGPKIAAKGAGAAAKDPVILFSAAQAQVAKLQRTRYTYQRTAFGNKRTGKGWLEMPDRAADTAGEQAELGQALRVWIKAQPFFRDSVQAEWKVSLQTVALADNPAVWLSALACGQAPRLRPAVTIGKEKVDLIIFDIAPADPNSCDHYTGLSALTGQGAVYLRQRDGGIQRVRYDLKYSDTLHGGHRDMPLLVEIDLKDWNSDALPPITEPVSPSGRATPTAAPAAGSGATYSAITFSSEFDQDKVAPVNPAKTFPYGVKIVYAYWTYSNVVPDSEFIYDWYRDGTRGSTAPPNTSQLRLERPSSGC